ncbi:hypothetical protein SacmaDRAFT_0666 [Saccharomonospora marina XMU15]|uniref:Uncharacterized protein n=1 Tax=Saccharomonospora marina XMU15 TaxID=882083 RepID=H5X677_9PSEU|nr:hypothetical protein [Saccharomonospora marina]EHR48962.1 hypothetical protein SacmaDRAFT_0666 [Saccharomonospora marina XMU15]
MGHVAEQRPDGRHDPEPQAGAEVGPVQDAAPQHPDPEQLRQFEQFQQFQQFLRFQEAQRAQRQIGTELTQHGQQSLLPTGTQDLVPQPPPTGSKVPGWLRWLGKKLLGWLIFFILLAIALTWAYNYFIGGDDDNSSESAAKMGGGTYKTNELLSKEPHEAVRSVYDAIAQTDPRTNTPLIADACGRFDNDNRQIQQRFASNLGYADCRQAVLGLHAEVTNVNDYAESIHPRRYDANAGSLRIDSCDFDVKGGPALGVFTVTQVEFGQWLITGHEPGPATCPKPTTATTGN